MITIFILITSLTCFFFITFCWFYNPLCEKKVHSHENLGGCSRSSRPSTFLKTDCTTSQIQRYNKIYTTIYVYLSLLFVKLGNYFSYLSPTFLEKKIFLIELMVMKFKEASIKLASWLNFFVFHIVFTFILKLLCLFSG